MKLNNKVRSLSILILVMLLIMTSFSSREFMRQHLGVSASSYSVQRDNLFTVYVNLGAPASGVFMFLEQMFL